MAKDMAEEVGEFKENPPTTHKPWIAMCVDMRDHDIVGLKRGKQWSRYEVWNWMLYEAARLDRRRTIQGRVIHLSRGQLAVSLRYLAREATWTVKMVRRFLERLRKHGMISLSVAAGEQMSLDFAAREVSDVCPKQGTGVTIVTLCNYDKYQKRVSQKGTARAQQGHSRGTAGAQDNTQNTETQRHSRSPTKGSTCEDTRDTRGSQIEDDPSGTDAALGERLPFTEDALAACEAMGFTRKTLVERYFARTKRSKRPIADPSAYLIAMAIDMAAKARGVSKEALKASLSKNTEERAAAYGQVNATPPEPSAPMRRIVERRCKIAKRDPLEMFAAWHASIKGTRVLHVDQHIDAFCSSWVRGGAVPNVGRAA